MFFVGVMSGTSCDGVDVVIVEYSDNESSGFKLLAGKTTAYPKLIKNSLLDLIDDQATPISVISQIDAQLGNFYADVINELLSEHKVDKSQVGAIGLHGQTIYHQPPSDTNQVTANTIQIGSAAITAQKTGITTVANFRQMDVAYGGQGAPLAPVLHQQLFDQKNRVVVVLNLGGIANITLLDGHHMIGFDTGPASCLMDLYVQLHHNQPFDESGQWAKQGEIDVDLLSDLLAEDYFGLPYPKSTGRELFNLSWLNQRLNKHSKVGQLNPADVQRTLLQLTVESIAMGLEQSIITVNQMVVCGGGVHNKFLMQQLQQRFDFEVFSSENFGINPDFIEAMLMAWLAEQNIRNNSLDLTAITGCKTPHVYGVKYKP